jgi:hypothetical protein
MNKKCGILSCLGPESAVEGFHIQRDEPEEYYMAEVIHKYDLSFQLIERLEMLNASAKKSGIKHGDLN